jgi:predicted DCC family thiol-disulfide oxidoreductase YuxK
VGLLLRNLSGVNLVACSTRTPRGDAAARAIGGDPAYTFALITGDKVYFGPDAYERILALSPGIPTRLSHAIAAAPDALRNGVYEWVANHRPLMSKLLGSGSDNAVPLDRFVAGGR